MNLLVELLEIVDKEKAHRKHKHEGSTGIRKLVYRPNSAGDRFLDQLKSVFYVLEQAGCLSGDAVITWLSSQTLSAGERAAAKDFLQAADWHLNGPAS